MKNVSGRSRSGQQSSVWRWNACAWLHGCWRRHMSYWQRLPVLCCHPCLCLQVLYSTGAGACSCEVYKYAWSRSCALLDLGLIVQRMEMQLKTRKNKKRNWRWKKPAVGAAFQYAPGCCNRCIQSVVPATPDETISWGVIPACPWDPCETCLCVSPAPWVPALSYGTSLSLSDIRPQLAKCLARGHHWVHLQGPLPRLPQPEHRGCA